MAAAADLLTVDTKVVERLSAPAENELQNVVKLFQRKVVRHRNQPGDERADFQQYDPDGQVPQTEEARRSIRPVYHGLLVKLQHCRGGSGLNILLHSTPTSKFGRIHP